MGKAHSLLLQSRSFPPPKRQFPRALRKPGPDQPAEQTSTIRDQFGAGQLAEKDNCPDGRVEKLLQFENITICPRAAKGQFDRRSFKVMFQLPLNILNRLRDTWHAMAWSRDAERNRAQSTARLCAAARSAHRAATLLAAYPPSPDAGRKL